MGTTKRRYDLFAIAVVFALAIVFEYQESFSLLEDETLSYRHIARTHFADEYHTTPLEDVVIVYTDEPFYEDYGAYPLRRVDLAEIISRLSSMGAAVIGVDILLDFNSAYGEDPVLAEALAEAGNVVLVSQAVIEDGRYQGVINHAIPAFDAVSSSGYSNISPNSAISESITRLRLYHEIAEDGEWPFAVRTVADYLGVEPELHGNALVIGDDIDVPLDQFNDIYIDYPLLPSNGEGGTVQLHEVAGLSAGDILFPEDEEELDEMSFLVADRIVLIGEVAEVAHDEFETSVGNVFGVEVIASSISTILRGGPLQAASLLTEFLVALSVMVALLATVKISNPLPRNAVSVGIIVAFAVFATFVYVAMGLVLSMSYILMASVFAIVVMNAHFYIVEMGQKAQIRDAFGQYLSPRVVADLVRDPEKLSLGGEEREMTAYFSDIAAFSTFSENMSPTELVNVLNDYLTEMCNIIIAAEGTVDKFEGDAIIAFWGAPSVQEDHARRACLASIDMRNALVPLRERWMAKGYPEINVRMGVNSGAMVVGNMGSAQRMNYTIMGDAVNLAARLEGANKAYDSGTLISEATYALCRDDVDVRELDRILVVGKRKPVTIYQLLDRKGKTAGLRADLMLQFEKAHKLYLAQDFAAARAAFKLCLSIDPTDGPSKTFLKRSDEYIAAPPSKDWDGVFRLTEKG